MAVEGEAPTVKQHPTTHKVGTFDEFCLKHGPRTNPLFLFHLKQAYLFHSPLLRIFYHMHKTARILLVLLTNSTKQVTTYQSAVITMRGRNDNSLPPRLKMMLTSGSCSFLGRSLLTASKDLTILGNEFARRMLDL